MELHHLHVDELGAERDTAIAWPSAAFSSDGELMWYIVAPAPVASRCRFGGNRDEAAAAIVEQHRAADADAGT